MPHRTLLILLSIAVAAIAPLGCGRSVSPSGSEGAADVRLGYFANLSHAPAVLGVDSGDFARALAPSDLKVKIFKSGPSLIESLFTGQIDIGYVGPGPVLTGFSSSNGEGLRVVAGAARNGVVIVARNGSGIHSMADLADKRIASPQRANTQDLAARHFLTAVLHQPDAAKVLAIPSSQHATMFLRGDVDASWVPEPTGSMLIGETGAHLVGEEKDLWPTRNFSTTVIVTTPQYLREHPDIIEKVLRVNHAWTVELAAHPQRHVGQLREALRKLNGRALPPDVMSAALGRIVFNDEPLPETFAALAQWSSDLGFAEGSPNVPSIFDLTILHRIQSEK